MFCSLLNLLPTRRMVPGLGLEPRLPGPKPGVLPLDDPGIIDLTNRLYQQSVITPQIIYIVN